MDFTCYYCGERRTRSGFCTIWRLYPVNADYCTVEMLRCMPYELRRYSRGECYLYDGFGRMITRVTIHRKGHNCPHISGNLPAFWGCINIVHY